MKKSNQKSKTYTEIQNKYGKKVEKHSFYAELKKQFQTCKLPKNKIQVDWQNIEVLDVDLRQIKNPLKSKSKRLIVLLGKDVNTLKQVVLKQELCSFDSEPRKVIRECLGKLMELGYSMEKAKTFIRFYLDLHNPVDPAPAFKVDGAIF